MRLSEIETDYLFTILNDVIIAAINHGGDSGGAYCTGGKKLAAEMLGLKNWLGADDYIIAEASGVLYFAKPWKEADA